MLEDWRIPDDLPLLRGLSWFDANYRSLEPIDMLKRYESGWRDRGVVADPSAEEAAFIKRLVHRYGSFLDP